MAAAAASAASGVGAAAAAAPAAGEAGPASAHFYVSTAQRSTVVTHAVTCHFTGLQPNLVVAQSTHLQVFTVTADGLEPVADLPLYGRVAVLDTFRPKGEDLDLLFVSTEAYQFCVLGYNVETKQFETRARGDTSAAVGRPADNGQIGQVDPDVRMIVLRVYEGLLKVIPIAATGELQDAFDVRLDEPFVYDIKFLHGCSKPTLAIIYEENSCRYVRTYEINTSDKEIVKSGWDIGDADLEADMLIPTPNGGLLVVGVNTVTYCTRKSAPRSVPLPDGVCATCFGRIDADGSRYLLGSTAGQIFMLALGAPGASGAADIRLERLGSTSVPTTLNYLDEGVVYVGSSYGDSQVVRLLTEPGEDASYIEVLETYTNIGPIGDFIVVDVDKQGQSQMITCSGVFGDGSLRVIRNGIGIQEHAIVDMPGVQGIWAMKSADEADQHSMLAISFVGQTAFLALTGEALEGAEVAGAVTDASSLYCGNVQGNLWVQVEQSSVRLIDPADCSLVASWSPADGKPLSVCACNRRQIVVASGATLQYLRVDGRAIVEAGRCELENEVSCLDISPLGGSDEALVCVAGQWTSISLSIINLAEMKETHKEALGGEIVARSVLMVSFEDVPHVLCGLGDGSLHSFTFDGEAVLSNPRKVSLGTQPIVLRAFTHEGTQHVFASSDRPTVVYSSNHKLLYSNVNVPEVTHMCAFHSDAYPNCLAMLGKELLTIGSIEEIRKLQVRSFPLGECPLRLAFDETSRTLCVGTLRQRYDSAMGEETESSFVKLIDFQTFDVLETIPLKPTEEVTSMTANKFKDDDTLYFCIGTAFVDPEEDEPTKGRILLMKVADQHLVQVAETATRGSVYSLEPFNGQLIAGINTEIIVYRLVDAGDQKSLKGVCGHYGQVLALHLKTKGDFILYGDLMRSMSLLSYRPEEETIAMVAKDERSLWMSAVEILDDDTFLGADNDFNLFICSRSGRPAAQEIVPMECMGEFHLGDLVNRFHQGSLAMRTRDTAVVDECSTLFATQSGTVGTILRLTHDEFVFLHAVQQRMNAVVKGVGGLSHDSWRSFKSETRVSSDGAVGFLDGDLIESFLDLPREKMDEVVVDLKIDDEGVKRSVGVEDLVRRIEDLSRRH